MIVAAFVFCAGCVPLTQTAVAGGRGYDHFDYYGDLRFGLLQIGPSNRGRTATVIPGKSYATAPDGRRHGISTEPHAFDIEQKHPYVRERIYVLDEQGRRITRKLSEGRWAFRFTLRTPGGMEARVFQADLSTFYYNPIIHGPPN